MKISQNKPKYIYYICMYVHEIFKISITSWANVRKMSVARPYISDLGLLGHHNIIHLELSVSCTYTYIYNIYI